MKEWFAKNWKWLAVAFVFIALAVSAKTFLPLNAWMKALSAWMERLGPVGAVVFVFVYAIATVLLIPGSVLTITAGLVFGLGLGTLEAWCGAVLGASVAFLIGRHLARQKIEEGTSSSAKLEAIDEAIGKQGWKMIGLLRLSPLIPFNVSNYFYGVTKVKFWPFVAATAVGVLPGMLLYVYLGVVGRVGLEAGGKQHSPLEYAFFGVGLVTTLLVTIWVGRIANRALARSGAPNARGSQS